MKITYSVEAHHTGKIDVFKDEVLILQAHLKRKIFVWADGVSTEDKIRCLALVTAVEKSK
jgi:hypothetical protein